MQGSVIDYPDGGGELSAWVVLRRGAKGSACGLSEWRQYQEEVRGLGVKEADERAEERRQGRAERCVAESVRRACSRVRRVVRYFGLTHMVTLTFPGEGVHEYDVALRYLQDFIHDHGELVRFDGKYVAVPELHPGGHGWHWHVLVCRRFTRRELASLRKGWTDFLGRRDIVPSGGAEFVRMDVKAWGSAVWAAGYASKYVGKTFESASVGKGRRRFLAPLGAVVEKQVFVASSVQEVAEVVRDVAPSAYLVEVNGEQGRPPIVYAAWDH